MYGWKMIDAGHASIDLFNSEKEAIKDASEFMVNEEFRDGQTEADVVIFMAVKTIRFREVAKIETELLETHWGGPATA